MPHMNMSEAAQWTGKDRSTLLKAIKAGRLSAEKNADGEWLIDPAELARVYRPARNFSEDRPSESRNNAQGFSEGNSQGSQAGELETLRQMNALLLEQMKTQRDDWKAEREDLKAERDRLLTMLEGQTRLLTHMNETASEPARRGWWQRLTGKG
jgi:hypothetical protein